jgi:hypothetical protein
MSYGGVNLVDTSQLSAPSAFSSPDGLATVAQYEAADNLVVPDTSNIDLPGQFLSIPGGAASPGAAAPADPSGINSLYLSPAVNPTPTGGYMTTAAAVLSSAAQGFSTFAKGSPSVAIPAARPAVAGASSIGGLFGGLNTTTNWLIVGGVVIVGVVVLVYIAKKA